MTDRGGSSPRKNGRQARRPHNPRIGPVLIESVERCWKKYLRELRRCRRTFSKESVHDLRVATRRLLSTLMVADIVYPDRGVRRIKRRLKRLFDAMSPLRDTQVQLLAIQSKVIEYPELETLLTILKVRERNLMNSAGRRLEKIDAVTTGRVIRSLRTGLRRHFSRPMIGEIGKRAVLGAALGRLNVAVWEREHVIVAQPATIHRARVAFKKFRYTLEAVAPLLPAVSKDMLKAMDAYQTRMGNIQDVEVMNRLVTRFAQGRPLAQRRKLSGFRRDLLAQRRKLIALYLESADELYSFRKPMLVSNERGMKL